LIKAVTVSDPQIASYRTMTAVGQLTVVDREGQVHHTEDRPSRSKSKDPASYWVWPAPTHVRKRRSGSPPTTSSKVGPLLSSDQLPAGMVTVAHSAESRDSPSRVLRQRH
jgi:hypothetical protein